MMVDAGASLTPVTVTSTVAVDVPPSLSLIVYVTDVVRVSPTARSSNAVPGSKLIAPPVPMVNAPPLVPVTAVPTLPATPLTADTTSVSPSGSVSSVRTLPVVIEFSAVLKLLATAVGPGLVTVHVNVCEVVAPDGSVAVTVTVYGPEALADGSITPVMTPVTESMLNPAGRPVDVKANTSVASGSLKLPLTSSDTT